jgi:starvation-inducible DNA-binding protein
MFDDQATAIFALIDVMAERVRKLDGDTVTSIGDITRRSAVKDEDNAALSAEKMVAQLRDDNAALVGRFKAIKALAGEAGDNATEGLVDDWTDQAERRVWFLAQTLK